MTPLESPSHGIDIRPPVNQAAVADLGLLVDTLGRNGALERYEGSLTTFYRDMKPRRPRLERTGPLAAALLRASLATGDIEVEILEAGGIRRVWRLGFGLRPRVRSPRRR
jgi:hypothetical protein